MRGRDWVRRLPRLALAAGLAIGLAIGLAGGMAGCEYDKGEPSRAIIADTTGVGDTSPGGDGGDQNATVTWEGEVEAVFATFCIRCHASTRSGTERNGAPPNANFDTYEGAVARANLALDRMSAGVMPPDADDVPAASVALVRAWIDAGMPR